MNPRSAFVSIVLPNLNYLVFLKDRTESIRDQTHEDWECVVIDGYSSDGSWEFFQKTAAADHRFRIFQEPPRGIYDAWNKGIERARGQFIYIATSDDTMAPDFLEQMLAALEACPTAGLAHCCLTLINENGASHPPERQWNRWEKVRFYGDWIQRYHLRRRPHDAIVHAGFSTVYSSVTQLLIRRSLFEKAGAFTDRFGPVSDFEWGLRAAMNTDTVHVPRYLATWRVHSRSATDKAFLGTAAFFEKLLRMVDSACDLNPGFEVPRNDLKRIYFDRYMDKLRAESTADRALRRIKMLAMGAKRSPSLAARYLLEKTVRGSAPRPGTTEAVEQLIERFPEARLEPILDLSGTSEGGGRPL